MKFAHVDLYVKLPEDFDGSFDDVLKLISKIRKDNKYTKPDENDYVAEISNNNSVSWVGNQSMMFKKLLDNDKNIIGTIYVCG